MRKLGVDKKRTTVRSSTIARLAAQPQPAARVPPLFPAQRASPLCPPNLNAPQQLAPHANQIPLQLPATQLPFGPQAAPQNRALSLARGRAQAIPDLRNLSLLPPFGSFSVLPQQPIRTRTGKRIARRRPRATGPQPMVRTAHSMQVADQKPFMDLHIDAPPSPIPRAVPANP